MARESHRGNLFYNQYEWSVSLYFKNAGRLRSLNPERIQASIRQWNYYVRNRHWDKPIEDVETQMLLDFAEFLSQRVHNSKMVFYQNWLYVYTNDDSWFDDVKQVPGVKEFNVTRAVISKQPDTIYLKKPSDWKYRTYFRERYWKLNDNQPYDTFRNFLLSRPDQYKVSPAFLKSKNRYRINCVASHHYVEHNDPGDALMLNLVLPNIVRKTMTIQGADK